VNALHDKLFRSVYEPTKSSGVAFLDAKTSLRANR
jgi:hypothetical protein